MDGLAEFLDTVGRNGLAAGRLRGLFHAVIGRRITTTDGRVISTGVTWRDLAELLKQARFDKELAREVGADPDTLSPRDRQRMWYSAIGLARVGSVDAHAQADDLAKLVEPLGYIVGSAPAPARPASEADRPAAPPPPEKGKSRRKK